MGSRTHFICALLLALAACFDGSSAKLNMDHVCALVNDGLMIADHDTCDTYYMCQGGKATVQSCSPGNYFSKETQNCVAQDQVRCAAASSVPCSGYALGSWAPVSGSCTDFFYCGASGPQRSTCPNGEYFNPLQQACVYPDQYYCVANSGSSDSADSNTSTDTDSGETITITEPINLCIFIKNGIFFGNPATCNGWNKCVDDALVSGVCPDNLEYDVLTMQCVYPSGYSCSQVTNDPYLSPRSCSTKGTKKAGTTCDTYYYCDGSNYDIVQCPSGEFYDTVSQTCVDRLDARNNCDRCQGTTKSFVNMYSSRNCTGYLYCLNGVEASTGYCPTGSYFDERSGACMEGASDPLLGCCNPEYYDATGSTTEADSDSTTEASGAATSDDSETTEETVTDSNDDATTEASA